MNFDFFNSAKIEKIIHHLLSKENAIKPVWNNLFHGIKNQEWNQKDIHAIASFLYHTDQYKNLISFFDYCIDNSLTLPWDFVSKLFSICEQEDKLKYIDFLIDGAREHKSLEKIFLEPSLAPLSPRLKKSYKDFLKKEKGKKAKRKEQFFAKIERANNENLFKEEGNILQQMMKMFPNDIDIKEKYEKHKEKWAKDLFHKKKQKGINKKRDTYRDTLSDEQKIYLDYLYKYIRELEIKQTQFIIDFSMIFYFLNAFDHALDILNLSESPSKEMDWLKIEIKLKLNHFLDVLSDATTLSEKYKDYPETPFIVSYMQAIALWHLGKTEKAIHFMQDIVNNRPNYRLASLYLSRWKRKGEIFES